MDGGGGRGMGFIGMFCPLEEPGERSQSETTVELICCVSAKRVFKNV